MTETLDPEFKTNGVGVNGTSPSIIKDIHLGDFVELYVDGSFFGRGDEESEKYGGYVSLLKGRTIGLSTTHQENRRHGYSCDDSNLQNEQHIVTISAGLVEKYRVFN